MKKEIQCDKCKGKGTTTATFCDECGEETTLGLYEGKMICWSCYFGKLSDDEIYKL
jgi:hypothetical protein